MPPLNKKKEKTYFKVSFITGRDMYQVCVKNIIQSDIIGMVELSDFIFPENKVIIDPGEEQIKKEFGNIKRSIVPYQAIIRIDEVPLTEETSIKLVNMENTEQKPPSPPSNIINFNNRKDS